MQVISLTDGGKELGEGRAVDLIFTGIRRMRDAGTQQTIVALSDARLYIVRTDSAAWRLSDATDTVARLYDAAGHALAVARVDQHDL
ncbi:hypothetical protein ACQJ99_08190 [Helicobacter pylori]|jgi:hypothetical protein|nr:hypothetical protein [Enterococcus faecium]ELG7156335.1 hypothetical protein [Staphylococcus aureus]HDH7443274.1 hypothetical protein [Escherichia coli]HEH8886042.1 hypothetical protein [Salmonella enterica]MDN3040654.1 hypothetical protein [Enterococcus faecium]HDW3906973.1 hypothetical protein [Escherichia coli]